MMANDVYDSEYDVYGYNTRLISDGGGRSRFEKKTNKVYQEFTGEIKNASERVWTRDRFADAPIAAGLRSPHGSSRLDGCDVNVKENNSNKRTRRAAAIHHGNNTRKTMATEK